MATDDPQRAEKRRRKNKRTAPPPSLPLFILDKSRLGEARLGGDDPRQRTERT